MSVSEDPELLPSGALFSSLGLEMEMLILFLLSSLECWCFFFAVGLDLLLFLWRPRWSLPFVGVAMELLSSSSDVMRSLLEACLELRVSKLVVMAFYFLP